MGRWLSNEERIAVNTTLEDARRRWVGTVLDHGEFTRTVVDVAWDEAGDRLILYTRGDGEDGCVPEIASRWEDE